MKLFSRVVMVIGAMILVLGIQLRAAGIAPTPRWAITPQFDMASDFSQGLARVGFGKTVDGVPPYEQYQRIDRYGYINTQGKLVIPAQYQDAGDFSEGLAWVKPTDSSELFGYINAQGKIVIPAQFTTVGNFVGGLAPVTTGTQQGYIDRQGKMVLKLNYDYLESFSEGLAKVGVSKTSADRGTQWKMGFINRRGKLVIPLRYELAHHFSQGLALAATAQKPGYINTKGRFVFTNPQIDPFVAGEFAEGLAVADLNAGACSAAASCEYVYIGTNGQVRIRHQGPIWTGARKFSGGVAPVAIGGGGRDAGGFFPVTNWGYINRQGKWAIAPQFDDAGRFAEGLAKVKVGSQYGYIKAPHR